MPNRIDPRQVKVDYDSDGNPLYVGVAASYDTAEADEAWEIWKLTFDADNQLTDGISRVLSWTNRTVGW